MQLVNTDIICLPDSQQQSFYLFPASHMQNWKKKPKKMVTKVPLNLCRGQTWPACSVMEQGRSASQSSSSCSKEAQGQAETVCAGRGRMLKCGQSRQDTRTGGPARALHSKLTSLGIYFERHAGPRRLVHSTTAESEHQLVTLSLC